MTYTVSDPARNAAVNAVTALFNVGSANPGGQILMRSSTTTIATLQMNNPAFGASSSGSAAMDTTGTIQGTVTPSGSSTIDRFRMSNRDGTTIIDGNAGSVATSGADINLSSVVVNQNDVIQLTGLTISVPSTGP